MTAWVRAVRTERSARLQLICFPHAGAGAAAFSPWIEQLPPHIAVLAVEPPGRGARVGEAPRRRMADMAEPLASAIAPYLDRPYVFYGHSLGGLVAFEVASILQQRGAVPPSRLLLGAARSPDRAHRGPALHTLPRDLFIRELRRMQGTPEGILRDPEMMDLALPALQADFEIIETYHALRGTPLDCPITVYHGLCDRLVADTDVAGWQVYSRRSFRLERVDAGHFFLHEPVFLERFRSELLEVARTCTTPSDRALTTGRCAS